MAKEDKAKVKMTVIHFETESDNATLQENIRAIAHTLSRALTSPPRVVHTPVQLTSGDGENTLNQLPEMDDYDDGTDIESKSAPSSQKKSGAARQYAQPEILDLDFTSGETPLKSFLEQKNPDGDIKRYLAIAYWFKHYRDTNEITMDHAYTAYRHMTWSDWPKDVSSPFRTMKKKAYGYMRAGSGRGLYAINHIGEGVVEQIGKG